MPEELNGDGGKESIAKKLEIFCNKENVRHHSTSVEIHRANGRAERALGTIRVALSKTKGLNLAIKENIKLIEARHISTLHSGIGEAPNEAWHFNEGIQKVTVNYSNYSK